MYKSPHHDKKGPFTGRIIIIIIIIIKIIIIIIKYIFLN